MNHPYIGLTASRVYSGGTMITGHIVYVGMYGTYATPDERMAPCAVLLLADGAHVCVDLNGLVVDHAEAVRRLASPTV